MPKNVTTKLRSCACAAAARSTLRRRTLGGEPVEGFSEDFAYDPTEPIATRPLVCNPSTAPLFLYCHDGNKNVSELLGLDGGLIGHYGYTSFGRVNSECASTSEGVAILSANPFRFSSEYHDAAIKGYQNEA